MAMLSFGRPMLDPDRVIAAYARLHHIERAQLVALMPQTRDITQVRHILMYLLRELTALSQDGIGLVMGGRDQATARSAIIGVCDRIGRDRDFRDHVAVVAQLICAEIEEARNVA